MNNTNIKTLEKLNIKLNNEQLKMFGSYERIFLEKNSQLNLISKNDEKLLFEKHIFDSLAINLFFKTIPDGSLLDIGTGGGFPSIPIAILYEELDIFALDSIRKKINAVEQIRTELNLTNLHPICERVENISDKFDYITSRAVAPLDKILQLSIPKLKRGGNLIAYKSKNAMNEIKEAKKTIKTLHIELTDTIEYSLPMKEIYERNLLIFTK